MVQYAMAQQDIRTIERLAFTDGDNYLKVVATDGHRLALP